MKTALAAAVSIAALTALGAAAPASAQEVEIRHAVARVVVIVEDRNDVGVEIEPGSANLPAPTVTRRGDEIRIDGELGRNPVRNCRSGPAGARQPGDGATVELKRGGRINVSDAPLIVLRTPRHVDVGVSDAVFGAIGRGATSIEFGNAGCGSWTIANTDGDLELSTAGSGDIQAGTSRGLEVSSAGSGSVSAGATRKLEASLAGSGDVMVARVDGPIEASIAGSGDVVVRAGDAPSVEANIVGSGSVDFGGRAGRVEGNIMGSGDVHVASASGQVERAVMGSGRVTIGN